MKPVKLVFRIHSQRVGGISYHGIKVDNPIELSACTNPIVHCPACCLMELRPVIRIAKLCDSAAVHLKPFGFCLRYKRLIGCDKLSHSLFGISAATYIVYSLINHHSGQTALSHHVTVETLHGRFAQTSRHHAIAANAKIQNAHFAP